MDTVIFDVKTQPEFLHRIKAACNAGQPATAAHISFPSPERMWKVLGEKRWTIVRAMAGAGEIGVRELARRVGRGVRAVHADTRVLLDAGVIDRTQAGKLLFPWRHIKVQFSVDALDAPPTDHPPALPPPATRATRAAPATSAGTAP